MILDSVPAIIFYKDAEGRVIRANKNLSDRLKIPVKDIVGKTTDELFPREQAENMRKDDQEVMISGKAKKNIIEPYDTPDGTRWALTDEIPHKDKEGKITGVICLSKDITIQRKSEQELLQSYRIILHFLKLSLIYILLFRKKAVLLIIC
jgi:PAS domain S-box-containing protein